MSAKGAASTSPCSVDSLCPHEPCATNVRGHVDFVQPTRPFRLSRTAIEHPLTNGKLEAILVVTASSGARSAFAPSYNKPIIVFYDDFGVDCPLGFWVIANPNGDQTMTAGMKFNVFVINP